MPGSSPVRTSDMSSRLCLSIPLLQHTMGACVGKRYRILRTTSRMNCEGMTNRTRSAPSKASSSSNVATMSWDRGISGRKREFKCCSLIDWRTSGSLTHWATRYPREAHSCASAVPHPPLPKTHTRNIFPPCGLPERLFRASGSTGNRRCVFPAECELLGPVQGSVADLFRATL